MRHCTHANAAVWTEMGKKVSREKRGQQKAALARAANFTLGEDR